MIKRHFGMLSFIGLVIVTIVSIWVNFHWHSFLPFSWIPPIMWELFCIWLQKKLSHSVTK